MSLVIFREIIGYGDCLFNVSFIYLEGGGSRVHQPHICWGVRTLQQGHLSIVGSDS